VEKKQNKEREGEKGEQKTEEESGDSFWGLSQAGWWDLHHLAASQPAIAEEAKWNSSYYNQQEYNY